MKIPQDIIIQLDKSGKWILYNVFTLDTVAVTSETLELLSAIEQNPNEIKRFENMKFPVWEIEIFSNYEGLLADPTRRIRKKEEWPQVKELDFNSLLKLLKEKNIIIEDETKYNERFKTKNSLLDKEHIGNFHQQLGQHLMLQKRENPSTWWANQKFTEDKKELKNTLYKAIQGNFLNDFFKERFDKTKKILDVGCGTGYYTKLMGKNGAEVLGIDPSNEYIDIAKKDSQNNVKFKRCDIGLPGNLDWIESNSFDYIFMSDAMLFYFVSPDPKQKQDIRILLSDIKRILKPNGRFFSMEPHGVFWLKPWLGEKERPFTIFTEYNKKLFSVTPNYQEIISTFIKNGFLLRDFKEIDVDQSYSKTDLRAANFAKEFPLWWFFELEPEK